MIRSGNEARLTIREVKDTDAGVYECNAGSISTKATVTVKGQVSSNTKNFVSSSIGFALQYQFVSCITCWISFSWLSTLN